jgi:hypothetical protein
MSVKGQSRPNWAVRAMSAFHPSATTEWTSQDVSNVPEADNRPPNGVRRTGRRPVVQNLRLQEGQQVGVDRFRLRGRHAMREALIGLQRAVL